MPVGPHPRHLFPVTREWVEKLNQAAQDLEQAAIERRLDDCFTEAEREFVLRVLRERAERRPK